jgi:hypothetical protein
VKLSPIFFPSRHTPAPAVGLFLSASVHGERGGFVHGAYADFLVSDPAETFLAAIDLAAISESNQVAQLGRLVKAKLATPPAWEKLRRGFDDLCRVSFSIHTSLAFAGPLQRESIYLHAMLGELLSPPATLRFGNPPLEEPGALPGDLLLCAYDAALAGRWTESSKAFQQALAVPAVAADLDGAHRYNAACAAARAKDEKLALRLLAEDHAARAEHHTRETRRALLAPGSAAEEARIDALFRGHAAHRRADPDLQGLPPGAAP